MFSTEIERDDFLKYWDQIRSNDHWFYRLPFSTFIRTDLTSKEISTLIYNKFGQVAHFVTRVTEDTWGRLSEGTWDNFKPYPKGE